MDETRKSKDLKVRSVPTLSSPLLALIALHVWRDNSIGSTDNCIAHPKLSKSEISFSFANRIRLRHSIHRF